MLTLVDPIHLLIYTISSTNGLHCEMGSTYRVSARGIYCGCGCCGCVDPLMEGDSSLLNKLRKLDFRGYRCPTTLLPIAIDVELSMSPFFWGAVNDAGRRKKSRSKHGPVSQTFTHSKNVNVNNHEEVWKGLFQRFGKFGGVCTERLFPQNFGNCLVRLGRLFSNSQKSLLL